MHGSVKGSVPVGVPDGVPVGVPDGVPGGVQGGVQWPWIHASSSLFAFPHEGERAITDGCK